ncbi:hypothetical protein BCR33DRAFT_717741, partial [Rhizoclosmatium globosum]
MSATPEAGQPCRSLNSAGRRCGMLQLAEQRVPWSPDPNSRRLVSRPWLSMPRR